MIAVAELSKKYKVRKMKDLDAESILNLCCGNAQFFDTEKRRPL